MHCSVWNLSSYVGYVESSSLSWTMKGQAWKKFMMDRDIYVWQSYVEIECKTTWLRPDYKEFTVPLGGLFRHIFNTSFKVPYRWTSILRFSLLRVSAPHSRVLVHCEIACLSLAVWTATRPLSLHFLAPLFRSLSERQHVEICLSFLGHLQSSATSCSCTSMTQALLELVWVSM